MKVGRSYIAAFSYGNGLFQETCEPCCRRFSQQRRIVATRYGVKPLASVARKDCAAFVTVKVRRNHVFAAPS